MSKTPPLSQIIDDLINGRIPDNKFTLSRGLHLQYRPATLDNPTNRLCCYRVGTQGPSLGELSIIRRELETLQAIVPALGGEFEVTGSDKRTRRCRVFSWLPTTPPTQAELPLALPDDAWRRMLED